MCLVGCGCNTEETENKSYAELRLMEETTAGGWSTKVSDYDVYIKDNAQDIDWDWRLLAALIWCESRFDPFAESAVGAKGLMQMMPLTAEKFGLDSISVHDPQASIKAGTRYILYLNKVFRKIEKEERAKFIIASYNAGPGHVIDAMKLAKKYGYNKYLWEGNVEKFLRLKSQQKYYQDDVCCFGRFRATLTIRHLDDVYEKYEEYKNITLNNL